MFRRAAILLVFTFLPVVAEAQSVHTVAQGETLWGIAGRYYAAPWRWREIFDANRDVVEDSHWIYPDEELLIPSSGPLAVAGPSRAGDGARTVHRVSAGETLWGIAGRHYAAPWRWPEIFDANRDIVGDPQTIYPGEELVIPGSSRASGTDSRTGVVTAAAPAPAPAAPPPQAEAPRAPPPQAEAPAAPPPQAEAPAAPPPQAEAPAAPLHESAPLDSVPPHRHRKSLPSGVKATPDSARAGAHVPNKTLAPEALPGLPGPPDEDPVKLTTIPAAYVLLPGDEIEAELFTASGERVAAASGRRVVDRRGYVAYPFVGPVQVEGLDAEAIRNLLVRRFSHFYREPVITLEVQLRVNVTGLVGAPGHYLVHPTATILDVIATAGGATGEVSVNNNPASNLGAVQLVRDGATTVLDLRPTEADPSILGMPVRSGDWVHVPPQPRSRVRDEVQFWGGLLSLLTSVAAALALVSGG